MNQLQQRDPQRFQTVNQMIRSGANPNGILKQMMGQANTQDIQNVFGQARQMGVPDNFLSNLQNMR